MKQSQRRKRHRVLVNRKIQVGFALFLLWMIAIAVFVTWTLTYYITWNGIMSHISPTGGLPGVINETGLVVIRALLPALLLICGLGAWVYFYLSHRIAGPLYRVQKALEAMARGEYPEKVTIRTHDYLGELSGALNDFLAVRRREKAELAARLEEIISRVRATGNQEKNLSPQSRSLVMLLERLLEKEKRRL